MTTYIKFTVCLLIVEILAGLWSLCTEEREELSRGVRGFSIATNIGWALWGAVLLAIEGSKQ